MKDGIDIQIYETDDGKCPYLEWESKLTRISRAKISVRLARIKLENFGDCKSIQGFSGLYELRIYFGKKKKKIVLLLLGGDKSNQKKDIKRSYQFRKNHLDS